VKRISELNAALDLQNQLKDRLHEIINTVHLPLPNSSEEREKVMRLQTNVKIVNGILDYFEKNNMVS